jgi:hypothetical protein
VSDTSVLIDLERGELLPCAFRLTRGFAVPDVLYERELKNFNGPQLLQLGLRVESLDPDAVAAAQRFRHDSRPLTVPDSFALALAQVRGWTLVTGDGPLRAQAAKEQVDCHGLLWLLDLLEAGSHATQQELFDGLSRIGAHERCRLPKAEVAIRIERYSRRK